MTKEIFEGEIKQIMDQAYQLSVRLGNLRTEAERSGLRDGGVIDAREYLKCVINSLRFALKMVNL